MAQLSPLSQEERKLFLQLLQRYLGTTCAHCQGVEIEDRHILTCCQCGVVIDDVKTIIPVVSAA